MHKRRLLCGRQEFFGEEERNGGNELKDVLHDTARRARATLVVCTHDAMHTRFL